MPTRKSLAIAIAVLGLGLTLFLSRSQGDEQPSLRQTDITPCETTNDSAATAYDLGTLYISDGNPEMAKVSLLKAISLDSQYCSAMDHLALAYRMSAQYDSAYYWYRRSLAINPLGQVANQNLATMFFAAGRYDSALVAYDRLIAFDSLDPEGYYGIGVVLLSAEEPLEAIPYLKFASALYEARQDEYLEKSWYVTGICYFDAEMYDSARSYFERVTTTFQEDTLRLFALGKCWLVDATHDTATALDYLHRANSAGSQSAKMLLEELKK